MAKTGTSFLSKGDTMYYIKSTEWGMEWCVMCQGVSGDYSLCSIALAESVLESKKPDAIARLFFEHKEDAVKAAEAFENAEVIEMNL